MMRCPGELELEVHLLGGGPAAVEQHLGGCSRCLARLEEMRRLGEEFRQEVFPATVEAVARASRRRRPSWLWSLAPISAAAAVALMVVVRPSPSYLGTKGGPLGLSVFVQGPNGVRAAADGEAVPADAALRFEVRPARPCRLWLVSVDAQGQVSRLYPASGEAGQVAAAGPLPGGALLDGRPGPERIYAVCTAAPVELAALESTVRAQVPSGEAGVRAARALSGLPAKTLQETLLLEKQP